MHKLVAICALVCVGVVCGQIPGTVYLHDISVPGYVAGPNNPYLTSNALVQWTFTLVPGSTTNYVISNTWNGVTWYLSCQPTANFNQETSAPAYNQFTVAPLGSSSYNIYCPFLEEYGWLCGQESSYGPELEFCSSAHSWSVIPQSYIVNTVPSTSPVFDETSGKYWAGAGNPYESSTPYAYTFTPVTGSIPLVYTISIGGQYLNGDSNNDGWSSDASDLYNQFVIYGAPGYIDHQHFIIGNIGAAEFSGFAWLGATSTPDGPCVQYGLNPYTWKLPNAPLL